LVRNSQQSWSWKRLPERNGPAGLRNLQQIECPFKSLLLHSSSKRIYAIRSLDSSIV
jgi:hypothetical protein